MSSAPGARPLDHRLATYGTLAPGEPNHHHLADLAGTWSNGYVLGHLSQDGWGATLGRGYPALTPHPEGEGYARIPITVHTADGEVEAYIYRHRETPSEQ